MKTTYTRRVYSLCLEIFGPVKARKTVKGKCRNHGRYTQRWNSQQKTDQMSIWSRAVSFLFGTSNRENDTTLVNNVELFVFGKETR